MRISNLKQKFDDIDNLLVDCIENYQEPNKFFTYSGSVIQACRNFTFALQANKRGIPGFDEWYEPWRDNMKRDVYMKWIHDKRNEIVKQGILGSESYASLITISDYRNIKVEEYFDYTTSTDEIILSARKKALKNPSLLHSTVGIERKYIVDIDGESTELVYLLLYAFHYIGLLFGDLEIYLKKKSIDKIPDDLSVLIKNAIPNNEEFRYFSFKVRDGSSIEMTSLRIDRDEAGIKHAKKRYGSLKKISKNTVINEAAEVFFENAKSMLKKDGTLLPSIIMRTPKGYQPMPVLFRDRAEKLKFSYSLPGILEQHQADGVMFISEAWVIEPKHLIKRLQEGKEGGRARKKQESLWLTMLTSTGETLDISSTIKRSEKKIYLGANRVNHPSPETLNFFHPVHLLWRSSYKK